MTNSTPGETLAEAICKALGTSLRHYMPTAKRDAVAVADKALAARAAAPEMYAALLDLERSGTLSRAQSNASGNPEWEIVSAAVNSARAAIARAEGRQP